MSESTGTPRSPNEMPTDSPEKQREARDMEQPGSDGQQGQPMDPKDASTTSPEKERERKELETETGNSK